MANGEVGSKLGHADITEDKLERVNHCYLNPDG